jgi:hypothetical protein
MRKTRTHARTHACTPPPPPPPSHLPPPHSHRNTACRTVAHWETRVRFPKARPGWLVCIAGAPVRTTRASVCVMPTARPQHAAERGVRKVLTVAGGVVVFADELSPLNVTGLCVSTGGIVLYNILRHRSAAAAAPVSADAAGSGSAGASGGSGSGVQEELAEAEALFGAGTGGVPSREGLAAVALVSHSARRELWDSDEE